MRTRRTRSEDCSLLCLILRLHVPCIRVCLDILEHTDTPQERLLPSTLQISNNGLIADLQDRAILCKLSLVHASGKFFVGSIRNAGFDLIPPFAVEFYINAAGVAKRIGLLLEPGLKGKMLWFDRCDT